MKRHLSLLVLATSLAAIPVVRAQEIVETLKVAVSQWKYLEHNDLLGNPIDPARIDEGFRTTWMDPAALGYDGPAFATGTGYFGYGEIDGAVITTNVWNPDGPNETDTPPSNLRHSVYFLTTINPTQPVSNLRFIGIIDDGCIIYLDGTELTRIKMPAGPDVWDLTAETSADELVPVSQVVAANLPAGVPFTLAVSLHNTSGTSSDIGFDLLIESVVPTVPVNDDFADATELTDPPPITATGANDNGVGGLGATREAGEPDHAGAAGGGSLWWKWTRKFRHVSS
jgi:hypothetical protein